MEKTGKGRNTFFGVFFYIYQEIKRQICGMELTLPLSNFYSECIDIFSE